MYTRFRKKRQSLGQLFFEHVLHLHRPCPGFRLFDLITKYVDYVQIRSVQPFVCRILVNKFAITFHRLFIFPDPCIGRSKLKHCVPSDRMLGKLLQYTFEPSDSLRKISILGIAAACLEDRVGNIAAIGIVIYDRRVTKPGIGKIAVKLIDRGPPQMLEVGKRRDGFN